MTRLRILDKLRRNVPSTSSDTPFRAFLVQEGPFETSDIWSVATQIMRAVFIAPSPNP